MLNLERLRALHAVADRGSVHAAARALHVTSSAISQQLAKLEEEVGQPLLERNGRGVRLTEAALLLADHTARALSVLTAAEAELDEQRTSVAGSLVVAAFPTAARGLAPRALKALAAAHPRLRVVLREQEPDVSVPLLVKGDLELLIAQDWADAPLAFPEGLSRATLLEDVADVALPASHKLAARSVVTLDELALDPWISWHPGTICYDGLLDALRSRGHEPFVSHTASEHATARPRRRGPRQRRDSPSRSRACSRWSADRPDQAGAAPVRVRRLAGGRKPTESDSRRRRRVSILCRVSWEKQLPRLDARPGVLPLASQVGGVTRRALENLRPPRSATPTRS